MAVKALLTVATDAEGSRADPRALLPLLGRPVLMHQAERLAEAGVGQIFVAAEAPSPRLADIVDRLRAQGIDIRMAAGVAALAESLTPTDRLVVVGDGHLPEPALVRRCAEAHTLRVLLMIDDAGTEAFERVDINHRWAGLANVGVAELRAVAALPEDWSPDSALMRQAMQHGAGTDLLRSSDLAALRIALPRSADDADVIGRRLLVEGAGEAGDPVDRLLVGPLALGWGQLASSRPAAAEHGWLAGPVLAIVGLALAGFGLAGGAGIAGCAAYVAAATDRRLAAFRGARRRSHHAVRATMVGLLALLPLLALARWPGDGAAILMPALLALLLTVAVEAAARSRGRPRWMPGGASVLLLVTAAALVGQLAWGIWAACLLLGAGLVAEAVGADAAAPGRPDNGLKRN